jgi:superoxide dismutase, Cu-Zn family
MRIGPSVALLACVTIACGKKDNESGSMADSAAMKPDTTAAAPSGAMQPGATATLKDAKGNDIGTLMLTDSASGIAISGHLMHLPPGEHGIHLHAVGQCDAPFTTAGPHWNPANKKHGTENPAGPHAGDMMNITVGADSSAQVAVMSTSGMLADLMDADGAAMVVHAKADDYKTDPSGNSGDRIACGIVNKK